MQEAVVVGQVRADSALGQGGGSGDGDGRN